MPRGTKRSTFMRVLGLFSLPLSARFAKGGIGGTEWSGRSRPGIQLRNRAEITNVIAARASAEEFLRGLPESPDLIVVDPPRSGLGKEAFRN